MPQTSLVLESKGRFEGSFIIYFGFPLILIPEVGERFLEVGWPGTALTDWLKAESDRWSVLTSLPPCRCHE